MSKCCWKYDVDRIVTKITYISFGDEALSQTLIVNMKNKQNKNAVSAKDRKAKCNKMIYASILLFKISKF